MYVIYQNLTVVYHTRDRADCLRMHDLMDDGRGVLRVEFLPLGHRDLHPRW